MTFHIRAGSVSEIHKHEGEWLFVDLGFSAESRSCGVLKDGGVPYNITFRELVNFAIREVTENDPRPLNLLLEAPLSAAFNKNGNPTGRSFEKQNGRTRYWYLQGGAVVAIAAGHLLRALVRCGAQRDVRLFEGFVSFKSSTAKSSHTEDVLKLREAVWNPAEAWIVTPDQIRRTDSDRIESAFAFAAMDFGIPPVVCA